MTIWIAVLVIAYVITTCLVWDQNKKLDAEIDALDQAIDRLQERLDGMK